MLESVSVLPITIQQIAVTKIGDAGTANPAKMCESRCVRAPVERKMKPLATALHRSAMMRRAKENKIAKMPEPIMSFGSAVMARAPCDQPAHAVPDDGQAAIIAGLNETIGVISPTKVAYPRELLLAVLLIIFAAKQSIERLLWRTMLLAPAR